MKMSGNDILRRLRYALDIKDSDMIQSFKNEGILVDKEKLLAFLKKEDEPGYIECKEETLEKFLDGFITLKRGPRE